MKLYVAAPWVNRADAVIAQDQLEAEGFEVTSHWIKRHYGDDEHDPTVLQAEAIEDFEDIVKADVFVILNLDKSEGKATELGFAYGLGMPIVLVGERSRNIFYHLPDINQSADMNDCVKKLKVVRDQMLEEGENV